MRLDQLTAEVDNRHPIRYQGLCIYPDQPICILDESPFRFLMVVNACTVLMEGITLESAGKTRSVLQPGGNGEFDNGYAGISSIYKDEKSQRLLGFYHAEDREGMGNLSDCPEVNAAYWSIGLAISKDNGRSFQKSGKILCASIEKDVTRRQHQGIGDVSVIPDKTSGYLYAYYTDLTPHTNNLPARIGMACCQIGNGATAETWCKYFDRDFNEPGLRGNESGVVTWPFDDVGDVFAPHITYVSIWRKYLMVCNLFAQSDHRNKMATTSGIYLYCSDDGIKWTYVKCLVTGLTNPIENMPYISHPGLYIDDVTANQARGSLHYSYCERGNEQSQRCLACCSITISRQIPVL
jgi:hypothetical protein